MLNAQKGGGGSLSPQFDKFARYTAAASTQAGSQKHSLIPSPDNRPVKQINHQMFYKTPAN